MKRIKRLELQKEIVRNLMVADLRRVHGGMTDTIIDTASGAYQTCTAREFAIDRDA